MVVAVLALVAAITGAAVAGPIASTSKLTKKDKKKVKNIATNVVNSLAPNLSVKSATTANQLSMYARVSSAGAVSNSLGFGSVSRPLTGVYCITGLARQPVGGQAVVDFDQSGFQVAQFGLGRGNGQPCPAGTQAFVFTYTSSGTTATNAGFFVELY
jgi:hypothetical protein